MALDPKARKVALNFPGGSLTASVGLLEAIFGPDMGGAGGTESTKQISVTGHSRVRVIGGPSTNVAANSYTLTKYPSIDKSGAAGGEAIALRVAGKSWTARLSGSHQDFVAFLKTTTLALSGPLFWFSEKGKQYGPISGTAALS